MLDAISRATKAATAIATAFALTTELGPVTGGDGGGLSAGDRVKVRVVSHSPFVKLTLDDGRVLHWGCHGRVEGDLAECGE